MAKRIKKVLGTNRNVVPGIGPVNNLYVKAGDFNPLVEEFNQAVDDTYTFDGNKTFTDDVTINGDLYVNGTIDGSISVSGVMTFDEPIIIEPISNQIVLGGVGATKTVTITAPTPANNAVVTIPDVGATGTVAMLQGAQAFTGAKTFNDKVCFGTFTPITTTGVSTTFPAASTTILVDVTTAADLSKLPNTTIANGQLYHVVIGTSAAGGVLEIKPLNGSEGIGWTSLTQTVAASVGATATFIWNTALSGWFLMSSYGFTVV